MDISTCSSSAESEVGPESVCPPTAHADHVKSWPSVEVQAGDLAEFVRWHAGWDLVEIQPWSDSRLVFPLLLHDIAWNTSQRAVVVRALEGMHPTKMACLAFRVEDVMAIRIGSACTGPERGIYVRTRQGRWVTIRLKFSQGRRENYLVAARLIEGSAEPGAALQMPSTVPDEAKTLAAAAGDSAGCTLESAQPVES